MTRPLEANFHISLKRRGISKRMQGIIMGAYREALAKCQAPQGYLHTRQNGLGDQEHRLSFSELPVEVWGIPGIDYSETFLVTVEAMYSVPTRLEYVGYRCRFFKEPKNWMHEWGRLPQEVNINSEYQMLYGGPLIPGKHASKISCKTCADRRTVPSHTTGYVMDCPDCCGEEG